MGFFLCHEVTDFRCYSLLLLQTGRHNSLLTIIITLISILRWIQVAADSLQLCSCWLQIECREGFPGVKSALVTCMIFMSFPAMFFSWCLITTVWGNTGTQTVCKNVEIVSWTCSYWWSAEVWNCPCHTYLVSPVFYLVPHACCM